MVAKGPDSSFTQINMGQRPRDGPETIDETNKKFRMWLNDVLQYHIDQYFERFFLDWVRVLIQAFDNEKLKKLLSFINDLYLRAKRPPPDIVVGNYMEHSIELNPLNLKNVQELEQLSDTIKQNPEMILAMTMEFDELILYILTNNSLAGHLKRCWPNIIMQFIEIVREFEKDKAVTKFKIAEALIGSKTKDSTWPGFLIVEYEALAVYYRWRRIIFQFEGQKFEFATEAIMKDELEAFAESSFDAAPYAWSILPINVQQLKKVLIKNNSQSPVFRIK